jgi:serine protease AprX
LATTDKTARVRQSQAKGNLQMSSTPPRHPESIRDRIQDVLRPTLVTPPVLKWLDDPRGEPLHLIIELNTKYPGGLMAARLLVEDFVRKTAPHGLDRNLQGAQHTFVFAQLKPFELAAILEKDSVAGRLAQARDPSAPLNVEAVVHREARAIRKVWESAPIQTLTTVSIRTVKADAAHAAFTALGQGITWAVLDSGIQADHPHFTQFANLKVAPPLTHRSFAPPRPDGSQFNPLQDEFGHGTHVAGIIAGSATPSSNSLVARQSVDASGRNPEFHLHPVGPICGMAPKCKLLSLRVLDDRGNGDATAVINALEWLIQLNGDGSSPLVHGVNLSAGYLPDPETYGSGQSPICRQVNRAVRSGIVVVVAAGNYGYAAINAVQRAGALQQWDAGAFASISDPANAELSIAVGSTHREQPHRYGISFFSSKGPTCDGRPKPDIVAPGERILSCAAGTAKQTIQQLLAIQRETIAAAPVAPIVPAAVAAAAPAVPAAPSVVIAPSTAAPPGASPAALAAAAAAQFDYLEDTGTSMAAPHAAGVVAAFLSVRREYIGEPEKVAALVISSAMDLKRDPDLQGAGVIDLFRMLQSV